MSKQIIDRYWNHEKSGPMTPKIKIKNCICGKLPSYYSSSGGFNYYGYYKCNDCNLFATGYHQFPGGVYAAMPNPTEVPKEPKLFVVYNDETNPEDGWNNFIKDIASSMVVV